MRNIGNGSIRSLLRWAGGKQQLLGRLLRFVPNNIEDLRYHEPFLGAATLFLALRPRKATLSDLNSSLIHCYEAVRDSPDQVASQLKVHAASDCEDHYYAVRKDYNVGRQSPTQAARFIYLNRTCFNGIFRVNRNGKFNVPYGRKEHPLFPTIDQLRDVSTALKQARLEVAPFNRVIDRCKAGDFLYVDPPYPPLNGTSYFAHYTLDRFTEEDQHQLARAVHGAAERGARIMMSNADVPLIRGLYRDFDAHPIEVTRYVTCKRKKHKVSELVLTNYGVGE